MKWAKRILALAALSASGAALAHPHGTVACSANIRVEQGRPAGISLRLEVDAINTEKILTQQVIDPKTGDILGPRGVMIKNLIAKAFREQDWLISLRPAMLPTGLLPTDQLLNTQLLNTQLSTMQLLTTTDSPNIPPPASPLPSAVPLLEKSPLSVKRTPEGKLLIAMELAADWSNQPESKGHQYAVACQDPTWFWVASFADAKSLIVDSPACRVQPMSDELKMPDASMALQTRFVLDCKPLQ